jgi:hypothetical protein
MSPMSPGRAERHGFEYKRNGTLSLFAALNTATGDVLGKTAPRDSNEPLARLGPSCDREDPKRAAATVHRLGSRMPSPSDSFQLFSPNSKAIYGRPVTVVSCL